jgi:hypothetical protein
VRFAPTLLTADEFTAAEGVFRHLDRDGEPRSLPLPAGSLAFTFCGVPVVYRMSGDVGGLRLHLADGTTRAIPGNTLDAETSHLLWSRSGRVAWLEVSLGSSFRPAAA